MSTALLVGKILTAILWLWAASCVASPGTWPWDGVGILVFWVLVVSHSIETAYFYPMVQGSPRKPRSELLLFFFFGYLHYTELKNAGLINPAPK